jgi:hypothetical protein
LSLYKAFVDEMYPCYGLYGDYDLKPEKFNRDETFLHTDSCEVVELTDEEVREYCLCLVCYMKWQTRFENEIKTVRKNPPELINGKW